MSAECFCDYEMPSFYSAEKRTARRQHRCNECGTQIQVGEQYEHVAAKWEGRVATVKTCCRCIALRDYVTAHVPCFCWAHHNMLDDAYNTVECYASEAPGLFMGYGRRRIAIKRAREKPRAALADPRGEK